jgi:hypothetical protein
MLAFAAVGTLTVVATVQNVDALSTIALVLAILAFVIQIVVFVVQSWTSGQQMLQSEAINADTRSLLAELKESARGTNALLAQQYDKVLERLLAATDQTVIETVKDGDLDELRTRLRVELIEVVRQEMSGNVVAAMPSMRRTAPWPRTAKRVTWRSALGSYPQEKTEFDRAMDALRRLSDDGRAGLFGLARDMANSVMDNSAIGMRYDGVIGGRELANEGLARHSEEHFAIEGTIITLSEYGVSVARLLTASGNPAYGVPAELEAMRRAAQERWEGPLERRRRSKALLAARDADFLGEP